LRADNILKRSGEAWMVNEPRVLMRIQETEDLLLMLQQHGRALRRGEGKCEVEMQPGIHAMLPRKRRRAFRILREDHCADGGDCLMKVATEGAVGGDSIPAPIVRVDDHDGVELARGLVPFGLARLYSSRTVGHFIAFLLMQSP